MGFLWLFGLFAVFLSPAPVRITDQRMERFEQRLRILADTDAPRQRAEQRWLEAELEVRNAKVRTDMDAHSPSRRAISGECLLAHIRIKSVGLQVASLC